MAVGNAMRFATLSHNIMYGLRLEELLPRYARYKSRMKQYGGLALFCLQENAAVAGGDAAGRIARVLGADRWRVARCPADERMATLYDAGRFELGEERSIELPALASLNALEALIIEGGLPEIKHAHRTMLRPKGGDAGAAPLAVLNVHLDAAGDNAHRKRQLEAAIEAAPKTDATARLLVAGDLNCFAVSRARMADDLASMLAPLKERGLADAHADAPEDTHFFARTTEAGAGHRLVRALGFLGLDLPGRYDVVASDAEKIASGYAHTPESDHDAPWAAFALPKLERTTQRT